MKRKNKTSTDWRCSVSSKTVKCRATVKEKNGTFIGYIDVLTSVKNIIGDNRLEEILIDFESAMWGAIRCVFPEVNIKGCTFHWTQSVWKKIQEQGLAPAYFNDEGSQIYLRKLMSLPFLPPEFIPTVFLNLAAEATTEPIKILAEYINKTWISSRVWPPKAWSWFMQTVRTNIPITMSKVGMDGSTDMLAEGSYSSTF